jgi:hypothetical protein
MYQYQIGYPHGLDGTKATVALAPQFRDLDWVMRRVEAMPSANSANAQVQDIHDMYLHSTTSLTRRLNRVPR